MPIAKTVHNDVTPLYPSGDFVEFTPNDATVLEGVRAVYTEGAGNLVVENGAGTEVTFVMPADGSGLPISPRKVKAATSVTKVVLFY